MSIPVFFTLKIVLGPSIFVSSGGEERRNGALNVIGFSIFSSFEKLNYTIQLYGDSWLHHQYYLVLEVNYFVPYLPNLFYSIEYGYILLNIFLQCFFSAGYDDVNNIVFYSELFTWYILRDMLYCCWLAYSNDEYPYNSSISSIKKTVPRAIVCWLGNIRHVLVFTVFGNNTNRSTILSSNISYLMKGWSKR